MKIAFKTGAFVVPLCFMFSMGFFDKIPLKIAIVSEAEGIVGAPLTPVSAAGVARRTTRRVVAREAAAVSTTAATTTAPAAGSQQAQATAQQQAGPSKAPSVGIGTVVQTLPGGCTSVVVEGASYSDCAGVFYKAAFQGNNLVYVVVENPLK